MRHILCFRAVSTEEELEQMLLTKVKDIILVSEYMCAQVWIYLIMLYFRLAKFIVPDTFMPLFGTFVSVNRDNIQESAQVNI